MNKYGLVYLASPYSHANVAVRERRFTDVCRAAARLMFQGFHVFSPIAHTHPIATHGELPLGWEFWREYDEVMVSRCDSLFVLMLDGWRESRGVAGEIEIAVRLGKQVRFLDPQSWVLMDVNLSSLQWFSVELNHCKDAR